MDKRPIAPLRTALLIVIAGALAACGSGNSSVLPLSGQSPAARLAPAKKHALPTKIKLFVPHRPRHASGKRLRPYFVANSTLGVSIAVYTHGGSTAIDTTNAGVAPGSPLCVAVTGGRSCTITAAAPAGNDDFVVKTYDAQPVSGGFSGANQLAIGTVTASIVRAHANQVNVTVGGVVAHGTLGLTTSSVPVIDNNSQTVTAGAQDADGNNIVSDGWYDANGNAVTMTIYATDAGQFNFAPATVTFASPSSTMNYASSTATPTQVQNGFGELFWATPSNGVAHGLATLTLTKPTVTEYGPLDAGTASYPKGITVGPDGALWFAESSTSVDQIGRITTTGTISEYATVDSGAGPYDIAAGSDGNLWFTENCIGKIAKITTGGTASAGVSAPGGAGSYPYGIVAGPSPQNQLWFVEEGTNKVGTFSPSNPAGTMIDYPTHSASSQPQNLAVGSDGNIWYTETAGSVNKIGKMTTGGTDDGDFSPLAQTSNTIDSGGITAGPDGQLWFAQCNNSVNNIYTIDSISTSGSTVNEYVQTTGTNPLRITTGPDGALWYAENESSKIARIDTQTHTVIEFPTITHSSSPWGIVKGPDGAIWFTECDGNRIGKLQ